MLIIHDQYSLVDYLTSDIDARIGASNSLTASQNLMFRAEPGHSSFTPDDPA
jgi:hypothetical protein